jgi:hypothetical protein
MNFDQSILSVSVPIVQGQKLAKATKKNYKKMCSKKFVEPSRWSADLKKNLTFDMKNKSTENTRRSDS